MDKRILEYDITENQLSNGDAYRGIIHHERVLNNASLIKEIVSRNTTVSRQEAIAVIDLYEELIQEHLNMGHTVTTGIFRADISMSGKFDSMTDKIDYKRHKARVVIRPAIGLNKKVCTGLRFHKRRQDRNNYFLSWVDEVGRKLPPRTISAGGVIRLSGKGFKAYKYENEHMLFLKDSERKTHDLRILTVAHARITAYVPPEVPAGQYMLCLVHKYGSVNRKFSEKAITVISADDV